MAKSDTISNVLSKCASEAEVANANFARGASAEEAFSSVRDAPEEAVQEFLAAAERNRQIAPPVLARILDQSNPSQNFRLSQANRPMIGQVIRRLMDEPDSSDKEERNRRELLLKGGDTASKFFKVAEKIVSVGKLPHPMVTAAHTATPGLLTGGGALVVSLISCACWVAAKRVMGLRQSN